MKQQQTNRLLFLLQMLVLTGIVGLAAFGLLSFNVASRYADLWQLLGTDKTSGTYNIKESFLGGYIQYHGARNLRNIAAGDRVSVTKDLLAYTKQYMDSEAFLKEYLANRQKHKPQEPAAPRTEQQIRADNIKSFKEGIGNLEKVLKTADASMKETLLSSIETLKESIKEYEDPKSEMVKLTITGEQIQYENNRKTYEEALKKWEAAYPAEVKLFIKKRLQQLLNVTKDVDFNAALVERNGRLYFTNAAYEKKSDNWKLAFRAGKDVTSAVREFALAWLAEIQ